ncbi:unnamed protein product [Cunninghamella blakesleeana]
MSTLPSEYIHDSKTHFNNQEYTKNVTTVSTSLEGDKQILSKRKQPDINVVNNSTQDSNKRPYTEKLSIENLARTRINNDKELWQILKTLKESSRTSGIIPRLEPHFIDLYKKGTTTSAYLCSSFTDHISTGIMDLGWGCGYRNTQMLMTFLQRKKQAGDVILQQVSDIHGLQILLERAWEEGFDPQGADQLNNRVYKTRKWIGTTEVYSILCYLGIRCTILDFHRPTGPNDTHEELMDWIQDYFQSAQISTSNKNKIVYITNRPPLYLQHSGHSRTVIGIELLKNGKRNLIMFDPGRRMLRSYHQKQEESHDPTEPEDDIDESALSSINDDDDDDEDDDEVSTPKEYNENNNNNSNNNNNNSNNNNNTTSASIPSPSSSNQGFASRIFSKLTPQTHLPANLLRPFRVDAKTIAKNKQYQILVLGEVVDNRSESGKLYWNEEKGYLLSEEERECKKIITSIGMTL